ncbi:fibronectin type III domain-containing protein 1 isoform X2 [Sphaeramia orbicularis]|uniref:fibronectin type III domain-containing protein 1 isoform X2 n=1 Tax=Sphaeramia orbicularis TaxID=375764 RepID=UPI0011810ED9|nr:fibronectin type III domain-containing protein 1 isoform X2 [Sphaeramia orbicularis]
MALGVSRTLLALFVTFCAPGCGWAAEKPLRSHNGKQTSVDKGLRESWEPSIHLDGRPVDRFVISSNKPMRAHRFTKEGKDNHSHPLEDVDPEWVNLDGFAVLGGAPVSNSAGPARSPQTSVRNEPSVQRATRVNRTAHPSGVSNTRTHRRPPQSSSGPRQPEKLVARTPRLDRRRQHYTKPQSDQRNRHSPKLTSESVHVVSLQAQKALGQSTPHSRAAAAKTTIPEPPEYEARDISVRVMSPQSVLISWIDPAVEMGKVEPAATASRSYTVKYREKGESARWEYKDSTQRRMMIDSLSADGMYEFSVRISQGENHGKWSVSVFQRTPESAPSGPPENFEVKPLRGKGTAVIATWDEPEEPNGRIREYILSYAPAMKPFGMKTVTYRGSITSATIDGLTPGDRYIFKIRATNRRGQGPQSKAFSVAMPGSSRGASSFSKNTDSSRSSQTPSKQDTDHEESDLELTEVPTEPTTTTPRPPSHPVNRRVRPLSQSRSYHSIFSSVRGSVRNGGGRSSFRDREKDKEEEEEEKPPPTTPPTTPAPVEETTTMEVIIEAKEPDNDVSPEFDEEEFRPLTTETPSLKVVTPSPTKPASRPKPPPRRPVKIRIHQRPGSKTSSDSSSSASSNPSTSSDSSSSSNPSTSSGSSSSNPSMSSGSSSSSNPSRSSGSSSSSNPSSSSGSSFSSNPSSSSGSSSSSNPSTSSHSSSSNPSTSSGSSSSSNPSTSSHSSSSSNPSSSSRSSSSSNPSTSSRSSSSFNPSSSSGSSSSSNPSTSSSSSSSSSSSTNPSSSSRIQESAAKRIDYTASTYPESKNTYDTLGTTHNKPVLETNATSVGRGSGTAGRLGGSRNGYGRRNSGILFRGNSTRNGYKPGSTSAGTSHLNFPSRSQNHATANTHSSATTSQSTYPSRTQNHETSNIFNSATSRSTSADGSNSQVTSDAHLDKSQSGSQSHATSNTHSSDTDPFTSQSSSKHPSTINTSGSSQSTSHRGSHIPVTSENTQNSHTSPGQDTVYKEGNDGSNYKETDTEESKAESTSSSQPSESERREESRSEKPAAPSRTRISSSLVERYPWLATRYPGRFGPGSRASSSRPEGRTPVTRTSSSMGASRPILRGTPTRVSGATGATGLSTIQETNEDSKPLSTDDSLKNGVGAESLKPSLTNQNVASSDTRKPTTSSSSSSSSSNSDSHHSSGHRDSDEPIHTGTVTDNNKNHNKNYFDVANSGKNEPTDAQTNPVLTSGDSHRSTEDNESVDTRETPSRTRPGSSPGVIPIHRRPNGGVNGRVRSPVLANRQFGGSRFPIRPQPAQNSRLGSSASEYSSSSSSDSYASSSVANPALTSNHETSNVPGVTRTGGLNGGSSQPTSSSSSSSSRDSLRGQGGRSRYPIVRGKPNNGGGLKPSNGNGKNGRPNLTVTNDKESSSSHGASKSNGQRFITGPDGTKWLVDLQRGVLMNSEGQILQDSQGKPKRVVLGEDGRTIFDHMGSPLVSQDGVALFGHGRDSRPVVNPKDKVIMVGGKPVLGLDLPRRRTTTTTTWAPTTTTELTTPDWYLEESTTAMPFPTCPPGTYSKIDEYGYPVLDPEGILDCYPEEESSGMEMDNMVTVIMVPDALALEKDEFLLQTTLPPPTTTTTTTTTSEIQTTDPVTGPFSKGPSSEFDLSGKKRFTAPYVNYIQKDPSAPCSLTEALEYLQVDVLENLMEKDSLAANQSQPPKNKPHNLTVVAMEGCHSFIILDWGRPIKDDMVSGYMVYSASYDDVLNNRWSSKTSSGTHLAVENLKPNSRYYFKVQAKNVFGLGPVSDMLTYVTESDDPLLIERPPGGEPIWIPFTFKYNPIHSSCKGSQYVKRTWYRKFVGVVLCNSLRYKIFMGDGLREPFYSIGDTFGQGEDHCQFVDSYRDGRTGPAYLSNNLPSAQGYYRAYRQEPVSFGVIGRRTPHPFVGWYECGVPIPGKW